MADLAPKRGIHEQTFCRWNKQFGALVASNDREPSQLRGAAPVSNTWPPIRAARGGAAARISNVAMV